MTKRVTVDFNSESIMLDNDNKDNDLLAVKRFYNHYDGVEGYLIEDKKEEVVFLVQDKMEADDITNFLNKQDEIINTLQKDAINSVEIIHMKQVLDEMIKFHEQYKSERAINNICWDCLTKLRKRWFKL